MPHTANDPPKLFRSLGHNDADLLSANNTASREAEQRWPLLKAMPPKEPMQTPALTAQEMQRWQPMESNEQGIRNAPPSPTGLGDILARSLKQMSTRAHAEANWPENRSQPRAAAPAPASHRVLAAHLTTDVHPLIPPTMQQLKTANAECNTEVHSDAVESEKEPAAESHATSDMPTDDSLKSIFARLEGKKNEAKHSIAVEKRPSYLGRLGRK